MLSEISRITGIFGSKDMIFVDFKETINNFFSKTILRKASM